MNKKTIIQVVVIIAAFSVSGIVIYNGFFSGAGAPASPQIATLGSSGGVPGTASGTPGSAVAQNLLPYGDKFDYQKIDDLQKQNFQFGVVQYPVLDPGEVGKDQISTMFQIPAAAGQ